MKSFLLSVMLLLSPLSALSGEAFVIGDKCDVYEAPSYSSSVLATLEYNDPINILDQTENGFYKIEWVCDNGYAYVSMDLVGNKGQDQDQIIAYNAKILQKTNLLSLTSEQSIGVLEKGTRVYLYEGYYKDRPFTPVKLVLNGVVTYGRVKTEFVRADGVNIALITALTAIIAIVTIIIVVFGIKKSRHKKLKS